MKRIKLALAALVASIGLLVAVPIASADYNYGCGVGDQAGFACQASATVYTVYTGGSTTYLHTGNAAMFVGNWHWPYMESVTCGSLVNYCRYTPHNATYRISNTKVGAYIEVYNQWNRQFCWGFGEVYGSDNLVSATTNMWVGGCGAY